MTRQDLRDVADLLRGTNVAVFSDEPYCHMVWKGTHESLLSEPGMLERSVAAYTFSKSYSMSGWRLGFSVASAEVSDAIGKMINTTLSCTPPIVQLAGKAALERDTTETADTVRPAEVSQEGRTVDERPESARRLSVARSGCNVLCISKRGARLQSTWDHQVTVTGGAFYFPRRCRRQIRCRVPGWRMFWRCWRRIPSIQLRRAGRAPATGT